MNKEKTWIRPFCFSINNDGYVCCGTHDHCSGMFFLEELYRMKDAIEKTLMLYEQESITDSFIKDEDEKAMEEELSRFSGNGRRDKKSPKVDDLYLIIDKTSMLLKIGRSKDVKKRLHQLQTANGNILELLFVLKNRGNIEDEVQEKFASLHANGEWYKYSEEIINEFISLGGKLLTNKTNKEKELKEKANDEFVDKVYAMYPSKCPVRNTYLGKCAKDKERIKKLLKIYSKEDIEKVVKKEIEEKYGKCYMSNFSTFLNNFPDPQSLFEEGISQECQETNNPYPQGYWQ